MGRIETKDHESGQFYSSYKQTDEFAWFTKINFDIYSITKGKFPDSYAACDVGSQYETKATDPLFPLDFPVDDAWWFKILTTERPWRIVLTT